MKIPKEFEDVFRGVELTEDEILPKTREALACPAEGKPRKEKKWID